LEAQIAKERQRGTELNEEIMRLQNFIKTLQEKLNGKNHQLLQNMPTASTSSDKTPFFLIPPI
jgi:flagellar biosynthesis/type III secretory pathway chaperone